MRFPLLAPVLALAIAAPVLGQVRSDSYKFLDAIKSGDGATVMQMLDEPGQRIVNSVDRNSGDGAVHILARNGNVRFLRYVLAKGANPNLLDGQGNTPATLAVQAGSIDTVQALIDYKADLNLGNRQGQTPLILAVLARRADLIHILLDSGANPDKTDTQQGMSARDYAKVDTRFPAALKLIEDSDAKRKPKGAVAGPSL